MTKPKFLYEELLESIQSITGAFAIGDTGALSIPSREDIKPILLAHVLEQQQVLDALEIVQQFMTTSEHTIRYSFKNPPALEAGNGGSVISPGLLPDEIDAFMSCMAGFKLPVWVEFDAGGQRRGVLCSPVAKNVNHDKFVLLEMFEGDEVLFLMPYYHIIEVVNGAHRRGVMDVTGAYGRYRRAEAQHQNIPLTDNDQIDSMMGRDVEVAMLLIASLAYKNTKTTPRDGESSSFFNVDMGSNRNFAAQREKEGYKVW